MKHFIITFIVASFLFASADCAFAFRCGNETISNGDSTELVLARCGRPQNKRFAVEKYQNRWESVEKWYYNCGSDDFIYILTIIHDVVSKEETAGRGSGVSRCQGTRQ